MRVFQLNTFCGEKSTGRITTEIAKLVEADGGKCEIGYGVESHSPDAARFGFRIGTPLERKVHGALRKGLDMEGYGSYAGTKRLLAEMERFQPELVHLHNLHGCYLHLPLLFAYLRRKNLPVLWTLHDCWPFTGHCAYFDYAGCTKWETECHHCPQQKSYPVCYGPDGSRRNYRMKKRLFASLDRLTFVAPCRWMQGPLGRSFLAAYPVRTIYNGVNRSVFCETPSALRTRYGLENQKIVLAVASEWDERKGLRFLIQAAREIGEGYRFVIIGLDEAQTLPAGMLGVAHTADTKELAAWYTAADCLANPTMEDNMPMVNLEALACGTPVVTFQTGGCPEAVDGSCGFVVKKGDVPALQSAIQTACAQKPAMKAGCLAQAVRFDSAKTFQSYVSLYKELCR